nr:hypothetical protein [Morchella crassipes]
MRRKRRAGRREGGGAAAGSCMATPPPQRGGAGGGKLRGGPPLLPGFLRCRPQAGRKKIQRFHYIQYIEIYWTNETCCVGRRGQQLLLRGGLPACFASASFPPFYIKKTLTSKMWGGCRGEDQLFYLT